MGAGFVVVTFSGNCFRVAEKGSHAADHVPPAPLRLPREPE
jgi:hypothetical protein